jgi:N-acetylmuramoyl-L-alanine amidase
LNQRARRTLPALAAAVLSLLAAAAGGPGARIPTPAGQAADPRAEVYNLRTYTHANFTRLVLDIGVLREFVSAEARDTGMITVDILQARLNPMVPTAVVPTGGDYIGGVRLIQKTPSTVRLQAAVNFGRIKRTQVFPLQDPFRIVVDIFPREPGEAAADPPTKAPGPDKPDSKAPQPAKPASAGYTMARQLGLGIKTIVIDPGHGGADPGCLDAKGHMEKVTALDISQRLKALLTAGGEFDVILTRDSDIHVPLETRTVLANQKRADLFISIHVNAYSDKRRRGIETFYLDVNQDQRVKELAARENATTSKTIGEMDAIMDKLKRSSRMGESQELAQKIQGNLIQYLSRAYPDVKDLGTRGGPLWVLIGSDMPAVLVEVSHFSNVEEAARLQEVAYRQKAAEGIAAGVRAYRKSLGKG